jgi:peptidylprolyl isomerase
MRVGFFMTVVFLCAVAGACQPAGDDDPLQAPSSIPAPSDVAAPPSDAVRTPSGLASKVLQVGMSNVRPGPRNNVRVHYTGWTTDGKMFDSSVVRNEPSEFGVSQVIPGWTEGLQLMVVGEKRRFWIPGNLAYDVPGARKDAPKGMLVFDVELLAVR